MTKDVHVLGGASAGAGVGAGAARPRTMSAKATLAEFVSTTAILHRVQAIHVQQLEQEIVKVFPRNIMPANAADWFSGRRRQNPNLLLTVLADFPDKFEILPDGRVKFLEIYSEKVAAKKLSDLVCLGLENFFESKIDRYGVFFFDPVDFEETEPFFSGLKHFSGQGHIQRSKLLPSFFAKNKGRFHYRSHSDYLKSVSHEPVEVKVNTMGVIAKMIDKNRGIIQFQDGEETESAVFHVKSLFVDGHRNAKNPMKLPPIKFDAYWVGETGDCQWNAALVWIGRRPSPKFCATVNDLGKNRVKKSNKNEKSGLKRGEVTSIRPNGAIVNIGPNKRAFIPGWSHRYRNQKGIHLTTSEGLSLDLKDKVTFYADPKKKMASFDCVGISVDLLRKNVLLDAQLEGQKSKGRNRKQSNASNKFTDDESDSEPKSHKKKSKKRTGTAVNYKQFLLREEIKEEEEYDSDVDPSFLDVVSFDPELDYDEYSDGEIPESEEEELVKESLAIITEVNEQKLEEKVKLAEEQTTESTTKVEKAKEVTTVVESKPAIETPVVNEVAPSSA